MSMSAFRKLVSCVLMIGFPVSLFAADSSAAMLYTHGAAWLNGAHIPSSSAIFSGDMLQTRSDSGADISAPGSSITVLGDTLVKFEGSSLKVEHGGVAIATSRGVATTAGDIRVVPASNSWTEFDVTDVNGTVNIAAKKGNLNVTDDSGTVLLAQGQQTTRDDQSDQSGSSSQSGSQSDKKKNSKNTQNAPSAASGGMLNSTLALGVGAAAIGGVAIWVLTKSTNPVSPSTPN
jgi:hypothetical protein